MSNEALDDFLAEVEDYLNGHQDVRDGADGPRPNKAMSLLVEARGWRESLKKRHGEAVERDAARYRAWRDGDVVVRPLEDGWETRHVDDPHWDVGSWFWDASLDAAIDKALDGRGRSEGRK